VRLDWSEAALADLDRFAEFLHDRHPRLAAVVAAAIVKKTEALTQHPSLGRPLSGRPQYRQVVLRVLNADYVFQYRIGGDRLTILRVFHARENREE
jgi:plasmid stabilization system protein ParE